MSLQDSSSLDRTIEDVLFLADKNVPQGTDKLTKRLDSSSLPYKLQAHIVLVAHTIVPEALKTGILE